MLEAPEIPLSQKTSRSPYKDSVLSEMQKKNHPSEQKARDQIAKGLRHIRKNPTSNSIFVEKRRILKEAQEQSLIDPLTQLYNRRHFDGDGSDTVLGIGELRREFDDAFRSQHDLSVLMIDIDSFKEYNDTYGHPEGDKALKTIADTIRQVIRDTDIPFRYGGEEFLIILPEANLINAEKAAEKLRKAIEKVQTLKRKVTISIGVSTFHNSKEWIDEVFNQSVETKDQLLQLTDDALYFSKKNGKDRVTAGNNLTREQILEIHPQEDK